MSKLTEFNEQWILQFESGRNWRSKIPSTETRRTFLRNLKRYCEAVNKNPDELIAFKIEGLRNVASEKEFQAERLLENYFTSCDLTDSAKEMLKNAVISFYKHNWRNLNPNVASNVQKTEPNKRCPTMADILELDNAMTCQRDKAILWFFESTSCRIGTVTKLKWKDLQKTNDAEIPYQLIIDALRLKGGGLGKYRGLKQITFVHSLAVEKLENYKVEAQRKGYTITENDPIFIAYNQKDKKVKRLESLAMNPIFDSASLTSWHDLETKRFSPHDFRDFFQSALESAGINSNVISPMMSHKVKGVDAHYSSHDIEELREKYRSALPYLLPQSIEKLKTETEEIKRKYEDLETKFVMKIDEKVGETLKAITKMLNEKGIEANYEEHGPES